MKIQATCHVRKPRCPIWKPLATRGYLSVNVLLLIKIKVSSSVTIVIYELLNSHNGQWLPYCTAQIWSISFLTERSIGHCWFKEQNKVRNKETTILIVRLDHAIATHSNQVVESNPNPVVLYGRLSSYHLSFLPIEVKFDYKIKNKKSHITQFGNFRAIKVQQVLPCRLQY